MQAVAPGALSAGGCDRCAKCGREEPPHVCQGQKLVGPHARRVAAKRSYSASEVRGAAKRRYPASEVRGGDERSYPASEVRGGSWEELPHAPKPEARGGGWEEQQTSEARGGGWEDQPHVQGAVAVRAQEGLEELSHVEGQEGWQ